MHDDAPGSTAPLHTLSRGDLDDRRRARAQTGRPARVRGGVLTLLSAARAPSIGQKRTHRQYGYVLRFAVVPRRKKNVDTFHSINPGVGIYEMALFFFHRFDRVPVGTRQTLTLLL